MPKRATGRYERTTVGGEEVAAFVPYALPPVEPPLVVDAALFAALGGVGKRHMRFPGGHVLPEQYVEQLRPWFVLSLDPAELVPGRAYAQNPANTGAFKAKPRELPRGAPVNCSPTFGWWWRKNGSKTVCLTSRPQHA